MWTRGVIALIGEITSEVDRCQVKLSSTLRPWTMEVSDIVNSDGDTELLQHLPQRNIVHDIGSCHLSHMQSSTNKLLSQFKKYDAWVFWIYISCEYTHLLIPQLNMNTFHMETIGLENIQETCLGNHKPSNVDERIVRYTDGAWPFAKPLPGIFTSRIKQFRKPH